jgi:hypothetical protein
LEDIFTSIQVYYKMIYDINLKLSKVSNSYHICYYDNSGNIKGILFELHLNQKISYSYNFQTNEHCKKYFLTKNLYKYLCKRINRIFLIEEACL